MSIRLQHKRAHVRQIEHCFSAVDSRLIVERSGCRTGVRAIARRGAVLLVLQEGRSPAW